MEKHSLIAERLAKAGSYAVGSVYILVGLMAILSFLGASGPNADEERIIGVVLDLPFGEFLIGLIVLGLVAYILWRVYEGITDPYNFRNDTPGIFKRIGVAVSAGGYGMIAYSAVEIIIQGGGDTNGEDEQIMMVSNVLGWPGGNWMVGIAGVILGVVSLIQIKYVAGGDYKKRIQWKRMPAWLAISTNVLAWAGYIARCIILGILGYFFVSAGVHSDPDDIGDTDSAFDFMGDFGTVGHIFFIAVALGTISYGCYMIINGIFYSFDEEE